jgi:hypothetical protein
VPGRNQSKIATDQHNTTLALIATDPHGPAQIRRLHRYNPQIKAKIKSKNKYNPQITQINAD